MEMPSPQATLPPQGMGRLPLILSAVVIELTLIGTAVIWGSLFMESPGASWAKLHWHWGDVILGVSLSVPLFALFWILERWPWGPLRKVREISDEVLRPMLRPCRWPDVLLFSALAGFCEELLFRGAVQTTFVQAFGLWPGIFASSLLFGLAHAINFTYIVAATTIGVLLGCLFYWTDSLLVVMVTHGLYDVWAMLHLISTASPEPAVPPVELSPEDANSVGPDPCTN